MPISPDRIPTRRELFKASGLFAIALVVGSCTPEGEAATGTIPTTDPLVAAPLTPTEFPPTPAQDSPAPTEQVPPTLNIEVLPTATPIPETELGDLANGIEFQLDGQKWQIGTNVPGHEITDLTNPDAFTTYLSRMGIPFGQGQQPVRVEFRNIDEDITQDEVMRYQSSDTSVWASFTIPVTESGVRVYRVYVTGEFIEQPDWTGEPQPSGATIDMVLGALYVDSAMWTPASNILEDSYWAVQAPGADAFTRINPEGITASYSPS